MLEKIFVFSLLILTHIYIILKVSSENRLNLRNIEISTGIYGKYGFIIDVFNLICTPADTYFISLPQNGP